MTLTIKPDKKVKKANHICVVDVDAKVEKKLKEELKDTKIIKRTHTLNKRINSKLSWEERFNNVKKLLDDYQSAKLVITSRLHCALPCLALGTPVLLLYDSNKKYTKDRLEDYAKIVNSMTTKVFLKKGIKTITEGVINPTQYLTIKRRVEKKVKDLLNNVILKNQSELPEPNMYIELYVKPKENIDKLYQVAVSRLLLTTKENKENKYAVEYWKKEFNKLLLINNPQEINMQKAELNNMIRKYEKLNIENQFLKNRISSLEQKTGRPNNKK